MSDQSNFGPQDFTPPPPPQPPAQPMPVPPWAYPQRPREGCLRRLLRGLGKLVFIVSILLNIYLLAALGAMAEPGQMDTTVLQTGNDTEVVAVYRLLGGIDEDAVERFRSFYRQTIHDGNVKAVVLRVDSPGGGAAASDQIHEMVRKLQTTGHKKVVVSMGSVAASGGYYVSASADEIFAENNTITGSIGVIMAWLVLKDTLGKIGMEAIVIKSSDAEGWKDVISAVKKPDERQRAALLGLLDSVQKRFEQVVREGRGERLKTRQDTYTVTVGEGLDAQLIQRTDTVPLNGQVFTPPEAMELGLIDAIGFEDDAIDRAGKLAELTKPKVMLYEPHKGFLTRLLEDRGPTGVTIGPELLDDLQTPRVLLMWKAE
jgi:protease-4